MLDTPLADMTDERQLVLTFHGLGDPQGPVDSGEAAFWVPVDWFEAIIAAAARDDRVVITFDDGNASDAQEALPRLRNAGIAATFFVLAGKLGDPGYLDADGVAQLHAGGMIVGSHGLHHRNWRDLDSLQLDAEVAGSSRRLSELLERTVDLVAVPFGSYDRRVLKVAQCTYRRVFTSDGGTSRPGDRLVPRTTITTNQSLDRWLDLVAGWRHRPPDPLRSLKRLAKRWR